MEVEKQIREIIEFYCGGTYENRNTATKEILQICQNLQLQQTGVIASCSNTYIGKEFVYTSRITNCKTIFKVARTDDRYGQTILVSENKNRYFLGDVIPHN